MRYSYLRKNWNLDTHFNNNDSSTQKLDVAMKAAGLK